MNPTRFDGKTSKGHVCSCTFHWVRDCCCTDDFKINQANQTDDVANLVLMEHIVSTFGGIGQ